MIHKRKTPQSNQSSAEEGVSDVDQDHHQTTDDSQEAPKPTEVTQDVGSEQNTKHSAPGPLSKYWLHKKWTVPVTVCVVVLLVLLIPLTRYKVLGLFLKESVDISVIDSTTNTPISGAHLQVGALSKVTPVNGKATMDLPVGNDTITISKQYYKSSSDTFLVSYNKSHNSLQVHLVATGRQVPIMILNKITNKPVSDAEIKVLDTEAKTDKNGKAIIVLPVKEAIQSGTVSASNYNQTKVKVQVTGQVVAANTFTITPTGSIYFLSNLSGKIDVVKTNLDGTDRQTVLAGTGNESPTDTVLLASRDWKYLALLTQRKSTGTPELDLIDTSTDTMSNIDEGDATFTPVGWSGDRFIYQVDRNNVQSWQNGQEALKSFNAPTKSLTVLAQTVAGGNQDEFVGDQFGSTYIFNNQVVYTMNWEGETYSKLATLNSVNTDGTDATVVKSFNTSYINASAYDEPNSLIIQYWNNGADTYYEYQDGQLTLATDITDQTFYNNTYPTYLLSPSGNQTFWSVPTDGKSNLLVGDKNGNNGAKVAILSDYSPYGWYTDSYLLVSKNGSELYIMPVGGGTPIPITDYFKPSQFYNNGYGGGYGGL